MHSSGVHDLSVASLVQGEAPANFSFPESRIVLNGSSSFLESLSGAFSVGFNGAYTAPLPPNISAAEMTAALMALSTVGELEVFRSDEATGRIWQARTTYW